jgi:hypothetical protein
MTPETIEELLREIPVDAAAGARERAVAAARAEIEGRRTPASAPRRPRRRALGVAFATALLGAALLTPPGRAATGWVGELVGIGDVGGSPTQKHRSDQAAGPAIVVNNGFAPDGSRYEWVVYHCRIDMRRQGLPGVVDGYGVDFEWPGRPGDGGAGGGSCEDAVGSDRGHPQVFQSFGTQILPSQFKGTADPDLVVSGETGRQVYGVRIVYVDRSGGRHRLRVDFERIGPKLRGRIVAKSSLGGTFVAFIPGDWADRDELESRLDLRALQGTGKLKLGPIGRRDRRQAARASKICAPKQPDFSTLDPSDPKDRKAAERAVAPYRRCIEAHGPASPVRYIALGKDGHVVGRMREPLMIAAPRRLVPKGPPLTKRPVQPEAVGKPVVLAHRSSPDGAPYEWFVSHFENKQGKVYGNCEDLWWPGTPVASGGFCGPGLPPPGAFGRRHPERVFAKPFGFLQDARPATRYLMLSGYARPSVDRVAVVYSGRDGKRHRASVELNRVDAALAKRMAASGPFGFFVAFVPRDGRKHPIEVIAYDASGAVLGRYEHRSDPLMH